MLNAATNRFSRKNLVVKSEGIDIYKGKPRNGTEVRVEIYKGNSSREDRQRFVKECKVLAQLYHKNLVQVFGWCNDRKMRAIVAEWTEGENVEMWLLGSVPPWKERLKVLMGVVEGMSYLQEQWPQVGRPEQDFERGHAGFIEYIRMNYPGNWRNLIDARMKLSENMVDQAKHGIGLGLICTDQSNSKYPSLNQIFNMLTTVYNSCPVKASENRSRTHGDGDRT
ncbi:hypothetical protein JCGZ_09134 [Jatropha curcas]|uniref:Serine-threonine/tyrosine-protein kinase catalytic domain-containing protein n=1 Tax=Jatropha curcas TaxID=180498 RepID=A0A067KF44_JATCU|nr:hypothetical protein JCGZ_09134 [Jatropha curcas]